MSTVHEINLDRIPSKATGYLNTVVLPRRKFKMGDILPQIHATRRGFKIDEKHLSKFRKICGWASSEYIPFIYPLVLAFHYHMGVLAHKDFPWSLRTLLGLRNHVVQRRRVKIDEMLDLSVHTLGLRIMPKGLEFDIHMQITSEEVVVWESVHVYYLRGNFGGKDVRPMPESLQPLDAIQFEEEWHAPIGGGITFAKLSGDINPIHYFTPWARLLGFQRDFCHTQRIISDCIQRLPGSDNLLNKESLRLDVTFKGPVYYGSKLAMKGEKKSGGYRFDIYSGLSDKPAIPGNIREVAANHDLLTEKQ